MSKRDTLKISRIEALSDGIFAIAMTILVLSFDTILTPPSFANDQYLIRAFLGMWPDLLHYIESFLILGAFWYQQHRQFHYIKNTNVTLLFMDIAGLMVIALIPFTTVLMSDFGHLKSAALIFEFNLFLAGMMFFLHWVYVSTVPELLHESANGYIIKYYKKRLMIIPVVSLCAMVLSIFQARMGAMLYLSVPAILILWRKDK